MWKNSPAFSIPKSCWMLLVPTTMSPTLSAGSSPPATPHSIRAPHPKRSSSRAVATPAFTFPAPDSTKTASRPAISPRQKASPAIVLTSPARSERWVNSSGRADMTPRSLFAMDEWAIRSAPTKATESMPTLPALPILRDACTGFARDAAREIIRIYVGDHGERTKADKSVVTDADHAAEAIIVAGLRAIAPDMAVVAEEEMAAGDRKSTRLNSSHITI